MLLICLNFTGCISNEEEYKHTVECAKYLKGIMKDPDSFEVCGDGAEYLYLDETKCVSINYRAQNSYGAYLTKKAYFYNGTYVGNEGDDYTKMSKSISEKFVEVRYNFDIYSLAGKHEADTIYKKYLSEEVNKGI